jgi:hypothetical protein
MARQTFESLWSKSTKPMRRIAPILRLAHPRQRAELHNTRKFAKVRYRRRRRVPDFVNSPSVRPRVRLPPRPSGGSRTPGWTNTCAGANAISPPSVTSISGPTAPEAEELAIIGEYVEVETGKGADALDRRPQLTAALSVARRARCSILVSKLDRLSRDVAFVSGLMAQRVPFIVAELVVLQQMRGE